MNELIAGVNRGEAEALRQFRHLLAAPEGAPFFRVLERQAEAALLATFTAPEDRVSREVIQHRLETLRAELAGSTPTPLEKLLADRIAACWLQMHHADLVAANMERENITLALGAYHRDRQDRAQRRYLGAIRTLAQVRRLQLPAVQINMAHQQIVNDAGSAAAGRER